MALFLIKAALPKWSGRAATYYFFTSLFKFQDPKDLHDDLIVRS